MTTPLDEKPFSNHRFDGAKEVPSRTTDSSAPLDEKGMEAAEAAWHQTDMGLRCKLSDAIRAYLSTAPAPDQSDHIPDAGKMVPPPVTRWVGGARLSELVRGSSAPIL